MIQSLHLLMFYTEAMTKIMTMISISSFLSHSVLAESLKTSHFLDGFYFFFTFLGPDTEVQMRGLMSR